MTGDAKCALKASYLIARRVVQSKKAFIIVEELILPPWTCVVRWSGRLLLRSWGPSHSQMEQWVTALLTWPQTYRVSFWREWKKAVFSLQLDEFTDVTNAAGFCSLSLGTAVCRRIYCFVESFQCEVQLRNVSAAWITTSRRIALTGRTVLECMQWWCSINDRQAAASSSRYLIVHQKPCSKKMSLEFNDEMDVSVTTINPIKHNAVNSRCFAKLCEGMEADHVQLLYHSEVRRLSRGLVLSHLFELRNKVYSFLTEKKSLLAHYQHLPDTFSLQNQLNASLQGRKSNIFFVAEKLHALGSKRAQEERNWCWFAHTSGITASGSFHWQHFKGAVGQTRPRLLLDSLKWVPMSSTKGCKAPSSTHNYLCESGFSIVATTKTKARKRLRASLEATLRVSLFPIPPRLDLIMSDRQGQVSH